MEEELNGNDAEKDSQSKVETKEGESKKENVYTAVTDGTPKKWKYKLQGDAYFCLDDDDIHDAEIYPTEDQTKDPDNKDPEVSKQCGEYSDQ